MRLKRLIFRAERLIGRFFYHGHIWLISDRKMAAGDNGEAFFRFLQDKDVNSVFAISRSCTDYNRLKTIGKVVDYDSFKYKFLLCVADCHCSSQLIHMENHAETPQIFLQHGVAYNNLNKMIGQIAHPNFYAIVSAEMESHELMNAPGDYLDKHIWLTGLPRFDYLKDKSKKIIVVAFTWRHAFADKTEDEIVKTDYFITLSKIISDKQLHDELSKKGYKLYVKLHPEMDGFRHLLNSTDDSCFYLQNYNSMYKEASVMITDFSSSITDFAYLHKPVIYFQFNSNEFFDNNPYLCRGKFDYCKDGFGPVVRTYEDFCAVLMNILDNECKMDAKYRERVDSFFKYTDKNNCDRVYKNICKLLRDGGSGPL